MKAVQFSEFGGPEVLGVADVEEPHAGPGQVRVAVRGAGVNPVDWKFRSEYLRTLGAEPTTYGDGLVERVRELAPEGVDLALDTAGRGALPELIEITGGPEHVVTTADFSAAEHGVRVGPALTAPAPAQPCASTPRAGRTCR